MDRSASWTNAERNAEYTPPSRVARMAIPSPRPPPGGTAEAVATARRAEHGTGGSILPVLPSASANASKRSSWTTPRSPSESHEDDNEYQPSNESFAPPPRRAEAAAMAAARRPEAVRQSDRLFATEMEQAQLAYMEQMYGTISLLNAELESERRSRAALEATAARASSESFPFEEDEVQDPKARSFVSVAPSYSPRKLRASPSPPSQPPTTQHRVARPPTSPRSVVKVQDGELCASLGKNAELRIRSRDMERSVEKTELELELARKQLKTAERRAENREEKLRALLKEKLNWHKELKATRAQVVEEKMRQVDLFREVEAAKRHFSAELDAIDQELRTAQEENAQLRAYSGEMKAQLHLQARRMDEMARQAQDEKTRFVAMIEDTRHRFREWKEGEAEALQAAHEQAGRTLRTEYELKLERHQDEKQKLRDKVNDLEVSMRLLQKDRALSPLELSLRKAAILGSKEGTGTVEAEQIETQSRVLELENLLAHSLEYQTRQESIIKLSEATISRLMQEREVTALENLSLHPFGVEQQLPRSEDLSYETQLMAASSPVRRMSSPRTPSRNHQPPTKDGRSPKSRPQTPRRIALAQEQDSATTKSASIPSSREQNLQEELVQLRKELAEAKAKAVEVPVPSDNSEQDKRTEVTAVDLQEVHEVVTGESSVNVAMETDNTVTVPSAEEEEVADESPRIFTTGDCIEKVPCESLTRSDESLAQDDERHADSLVQDAVVSADEIDATSSLDVQPPETEPSKSDAFEILTEETNDPIEEDSGEVPMDESSDAARDAIIAQESEPVQVSSPEDTSSDDLAGEKLLAEVEITEVVTEKAVDAVAAQESISLLSETAAEEPHPATDADVHPDATVNGETLAFEGGKDHFEADSTSQDDDSSTANDQQELSVKDVADESLEVQNSFPESPAPSSQEVIPDELTEEPLPYQVNLPSGVSVSNGSDDNDKAEVQHFDTEMIQAETTELQSSDVEAADEPELVRPSESEAKEVDIKDGELLVDDIEKVPGERELSKFVDVLGEEFKDDNPETSSLPHSSSEIIEIPKDIVDVGEDILREVMQELSAAHVPVDADEKETVSTEIDLAKNDIVHSDRVEMPSSAHTIEFMDVTEMEQTAAPTDQVEKFDDIHASETDITSELQEETVESQPERLFPERGEVTPVSPSPETIAAEALVVLVECIAISLVSVRRKSNESNDGALTCSSLDNSEDAIASTASEEVAIDSAETMDSTPILNSPSDELMSCEQVTNTANPIAVLDDVKDSRTVIEDPVSEKEKLVAVVTKEVASNFVKEVIEMFDSAPVSSENQEGDNVIEERVSTKVAEDIIVATVEDEDNTAEISTTDATETTAEAQPTATVIPERSIVEAANVSPVDEEGDDTTACSEPEIPVQDLTVESPADTFVVARDFVDAVEREALSAVLESLQDVNYSVRFQADSEHEHEERESNSTRSIIESCNLSSEEQEEYDTVVGSELDVEAAAQVSTADVVDEVPQAVFDPEAEQGSNDELAEFEQILESCTATVESEVVANLFDIQEPIVSEFSAQEIISDVACHFASEVITEVLTKQLESCGEDENMAAAQQTNEVVSVFEENHSSQQETSPAESDSATAEVDVEAFTVESEQELREVSQSAEAEEVSGMHTLSMETAEATQTTDDNVMVQSDDASTPTVLVEAQPEEFVQASEPEPVEAGETAPLLNVETILAADAADLQSEEDGNAVKLLLDEMTANIEDVASFTELDQCVSSSASHENPDNAPSSSVDRANDLLAGEAGIPVHDQVEEDCSLPSGCESDQISDATDEKHEIDDIETIASVVTSIVDSICYPVELGTASCKMEKSQTVDKKDEDLELIDNTSVEAPASTREKPSSGLATEGTIEGNEVSPLGAETSESLDTDARVQDPDKHGDIMPYAATSVGFTLDGDEAVAHFPLENLVDRVTGGDDTLRSIDEAELPLDDFNTSLDAAVNYEVAKVVTALCIYVEKKVAPKHRSRSVHFTRDTRVDQSGRQHQARRSVLSWQAPVDTAFTKETVQNAAKQRAIRRRTSRRTIGDLLAFPTELARFTASDTTLLAYDARHEQGQQPCSLLDYSILNINPECRHIHLDDQDERTESKIVGKRKTLMQELHSKNLALRQIPRFNYMPMRIKFQWSDFVVATPVRPSNTTCRYGEGHISKSPVEPLRLLQKKGVKLPCGTYVIVSAFIRPLEDGNENLRVQIYEAERVEEFQFDFSEDIMKKYHLESTEMEAQSLEFLGHLEFRSDEDTIIIKLPEKKAGGGGKTEGDRIHSERTMVGGGDPRKRVAKPRRMSAYHQNRPASLPAMAAEFSSSSSSLPSRTGTQMPPSESSPTQV